MTLRRKNSKNNRKQELRLTEEEKQHILNRRKLMAKKRSKRNTLPQLYFYKGMPKMRKPKNNGIFEFSKMKMPDNGLFEFPFMENNLSKYSKKKNSKNHYFSSHSEMKQYSNNNGHQQFIHKIRDEDPEKIDITVNKNGKKTHKTYKKRL